MMSQRLNTFILNLRKLEFMKFGIELKDPTLFDKLSKEYGDDEYYVDLDYDFQHRIAKTNFELFDEEYVDYYGSTLYKFKCPEFEAFISKFGVDELMTELSLIFEVYFDDYIYYFVSWHIVRNKVIIAENDGNCNYSSIIMAALLLKKRVKDLCEQKSLAFSEEHPVYCGNLYQVV